eukprot:4570337-Alexandrium_andersonii.AAC.1
MGRCCHVSDACILGARAAKASQLRFDWNQFLLAIVALSVGISLGACRCGGARLGWGLLWCFFGNG